MADIQATNANQLGFNTNQQSFQGPLQQAEGVMNLKRGLNNLTSFTGQQNTSTPTSATAARSFNPSPTPQTGSSGSFPTPEMFEAEHFYESQGLSPEQASAKVGVMTGESGTHLNPGAFNPNDPQGGAHGSMQWVGDRWTKLQQWAQTNGLDPNNRTTQLKYSMIEPGEQQYMSALRAAPDLNSATKAAISTERPKGWTAQHPEQGAGFAQRQGNAQRLLQEVIRRKGGAPPVSQQDNQLTQGAAPNASGSFALPQS